MLNFFLDFIFPKRCVNCGTFGSYLCTSCEAKIKVLENDICPVCERPAIGGATHPGCKTRYSLDGLISFYRYDGPVKALVKRLKYKPYISDLVEILVGGIFSNKQSLRSSELEAMKQYNNYVVIPVPLHPQRERERGFNQASLIGKALAKKLGLEFRDGVLKRTRYTKPQAMLKEKDRRKNLAAAFSFYPNYTLDAKPLGEAASSAYTLLIDDVWTTGSTMRACANILKRGGAKKVWAFTIAR